MARAIHTIKEVIGLLNDGRFAARCDDELAAIITALTAIDGAASASLTMTLKISHIEGRLDISPQVIGKLPQPKGFSNSVFWSDGDGLSLEHPKQTSIFDGPKPVAFNER